MRTTFNENIKNNIVDKIKNIINDNIKYNINEDKAREKIANRV